MAAQFRARNGACGPAAVLVDGAGDQFLAGAALAGDQHRHVLGGDAADGLVHLAHGRAAADHAALRVRFRRGFAPPRPDWRMAPGHVQRFADDPPQHGQVERLEQAIKGALLHGLDGRVGPLRVPVTKITGTRAIEAADLLVDLQTGLGRAGPQVRTMTSGESVRMCSSPSGPVSATCTR